MRAIPPFALALLTSVAALAADPPVRFDRIVIDDAFPGAYQVEVADVDGDGKPDLVVLGGPTIAWYQNPTWTRRVIATAGSPLKADIISSATVDLDGDGKAEVAIACDFAMNTPTRGQLFVASQGATLDAPWTFRKIQDVPSIHRLRWGDMDGDRKPELIVAPLFGPKSAPPAYDQDFARVIELRPDPDHPAAGPWAGRDIMRRPVVHAVQVFDSRDDGARGRRDGGVVTADNAGLSFAQALSRQAGAMASWEALPIPLVTGAAGPAPKRGCSDVRIVRIRGDAKAFVTIEPWHGSELVVWNEPVRSPDAGRRAEEFFVGLGKILRGDLSLGYSRAVIDATLDDGHALWTADVDGDGTDEVFAGHRGKDHRVAMYRLEGETWARTVLDAGVAAQDLRGGDLDGDGVPDVVAVGGTTHNVVWYRPARAAAAK